LIANVTNKHVLIYARDKQILAISMIVLEEQAENVCKKMKMLNNIFHTRWMDSYFCSRFYSD